MDNFFNILRTIRSLLKMFLFGSALVVYFGASICIYFVCLFNVKRARFFLVKIVSVTCFVGLKIIGINVVQKNKNQIDSKNKLIISNHLSYVDVLVLSSIYPSCFVTSKEMKNTFFLGQLCMLGGCLFVDRKNRRNIHKEVYELTETLNNQLSVAIFPEAKSTDGTSVLPFKRPLFQAAIDSGQDVLPVCLNYKKLDSENITLKNRDIVFWYGDMSFFSHALKLFSYKQLIVEIETLPVIAIKKFTDKNELADHCRELISAKYTEIKI